MTDERQPSDAAAALVRRLAAEAELVDDGAFTLEFAAAREKLANYRQADPHAFVLLLVEAAHLLDACSQIEFSITDDEAHVTLVDARSSENELQTLFDALFVDLGNVAPDAKQHALGRQRLALAIDAGLARPGAKVELRATSIDRREIVVKFGAEGQTLEEGEREADASSGIALVFSWPAPWSGASETQRALLETRARFARLPVFVEDQRVDLEDALKDVAVPVDVVTAAGAIVGRAGRSIARSEALAILVANGVVIEELREPDWQPGFVALVDASDLRRDLSLTKLVRDEAYAGHVEAIRKAHAGLGVAPETKVIHAFIEGHQGSLGGEFLLGLFLFLLGAVPVVFVPFAIFGTFLAVGFGPWLMWNVIETWRDDAARRRGILAVGRVESAEVKIWPKSIYNEVALKLRVSVADREPFVASLSCKAKPGVETTQFERGAYFHVRVDRHDPKRVWLDESRMDE